MHTYRSRSPDHALRAGLFHLGLHGVLKASRNGPTLSAPGPVMTVWEPLACRVSLCPVRDANPFFHLFEAMWMLAGRNDVAFVERFNSRIGQFSDDKDVLHGAYGFRWREWFGHDQLEQLAALLRADPHTRRAVLTMWSPSGDLWASEGCGGLDGADVPCNTQVYFRPVNGVLDMTVMARSNDMVWGAYGANIVHFSFLHAYMAGAAGLGLGTLYQLSNDMHIYTERPDVRRLIDNEPTRPTATHTGLPSFTTQEDADAFLRAAEAFCDDDYLAASACPFFEQQVLPMEAAWKAYKRGDFELAQACLDPGQYTWHRAAAAWLGRRCVARAHKAAEGLQ